MRGTNILGKTTLFVPLTEGDSRRSPAGGQGLSNPEFSQRRQRALCRFLNSTTMLSARAFPTFLGACEAASPQKTCPALLSDVGPSPSFSDESVNSIAQYAECECSGVLSPAPSRTRRTR